MTNPVIPPTPLIIQVPGHWRRALWEQSLDLPLFSFHRQSILDGEDYFGLGIDFGSKMGDHSYEYQLALFGLVACLTLEDLPSRTLLDYRLRHYGHDRVPGRP